MSIADNIFFVGYIKIWLFFVGRKVRKLKKQKKGLIDRWEIPLQDELLATAKLEEYGLTRKYN